MPTDRTRGRSRSRSPRGLYTGDSRKRRDDSPKHTSPRRPGRYDDHEPHPRIKEDAARQRGREMRSRSRSRRRRSRTRSRSLGSRRRSRSRSRSRSPARKRRRRSRSDSRDRDRKKERRSMSRSRSRDRKRRERERSLTSSSDDGEAKRRRERRKDKDRKRSKSRERKREKKKEKKEKKGKKKSSGALQWGKYGIISEVDIFVKGPEFSTWLVEERKINPETISKDQKKKEFARYVEDFNTATLPHEKYYHMEAYERRMSALRQGDFVPPPDDAYDPQADMKAIIGAHKKKPVEHESYLSKEQLLELRKVQNERIEAGKMKLLGMDIKQNMGVRMDGTMFDD